MKADMKETRKSLYWRQKLLGPPHVARIVVLTLSLSESSSSSSIPT